MVMSFTVTSAADLSFLASGVSYSLELFVSTHEYGNARCYFFMPNNFVLNYVAKLFALRKTCFESCILMNELFMSRGCVLYILLCPGCIDDTEKPL